MISHFLCAIAVPPEHAGARPSVFHSFCRVSDQMLFQTTCLQTRVCNVENMNILSFMVVAGEVKKCQFIIECVCIEV